MGALLFLFISGACTKYQIRNEEPTGPENPLVEVNSCDTDTVYFQNTILPLVVSSCATSGCHDEASHKDGIVLTDYTSIIRTGKIKAGDPEDSEFFESLTDKGDDLMPPPPLAAFNTGEVDLIRIWIEQGALNNECMLPCESYAHSYSDVIWPMMEQYCTGCHNPSYPGGGISIEGYDDLVGLANTGSLMGSIRYEQAYSPMPTNQQLPDCKIAQVQKWIDEGFPE